MKLGSCHRFDLWNTEVALGDLKKKMCTAGLSALDASFDIRTYLKAV